MSQAIAGWAARVLVAPPALLPCPFCGRAPRWEHHPDVGDIVRVACRAPECAVQPATEYLLEEYGHELRGAWNQRRG